MDRKEFNKKMNSMVIACWTIMAAALLFAYLGEFVNDRRSFEYTATFAVMALFPLGAGILLNRFLGGADLRFRYFAAAGYMILYSYLLFASRSAAVFVYVIPMTAVLIVYMDVRLILYVVGYAMGINVLSVVYGGQIMPEPEAFYEIQLSCIFLSGLFLVKTAILIKSGNEKLSKLCEDVEKDALTGVYNRRYFSEHIDEMFGMAEGTHGLSIAFFDIDNFKEFNSMYGHDFGDIVLKAFCSSILGIIGSYKDYKLIRMGGDEFVVISGQDSFEDFSKKIHEVQLCLGGQCPINCGRHVKISASIGLANASVDDCSDYFLLYQIADKRLYKAKEQGKNRIVAKGCTA